MEPHGLPESEAEEQQLEARYLRRREAPGPLDTRRLMETNAN